MPPDSDMAFKEENMKIKRLAILSALALPAAPIAVNADTVSYTFTGTVSSGFDDIGLFGAPGSENLAGASFTAVFDINLARESIGGDILQVSGGTEFGTASPFVSESLTINGHTTNFVGGFFDIALVNVGTQFMVDALAANNNSLNFSFSNSSGSLPFSSLSAPLSYTAMASDETSGALVLGDGTGQAEADLNLLPTEVTIAPVPLPAAAWLMLSGLGGLGVMARKRKAA
jgi:hypothetical protein